MISEQALFERFGRAYPVGTVLFREGDLGREMFVIQSGEVEISRRIKERERVLAVLPPGEFFGEMAIINNRPRSATARVVVEARLLVIDAKTFEAMLRGRVEIAVRMIKTLAGRLEQANQQIELLLLKDANHRVVQCLRQLAVQQTGGETSGGAVFIPIQLDGLAARVDLPAHEVEDILGRLSTAKLVVAAHHAGVHADGYVIPEVGRLLEFLEFLEMKERFG